jgi:hypothetical protein
LLGLKRNRWAGLGLLVVALVFGVRLLTLDPERTPEIAAIRVLRGSDTGPRADGRLDFVVSNVGEPAIVDRVLFVPKRDLDPLQGAHLCGARLHYLPTYIPSGEARADAAEVTRLIARGEGYCVDSDYGDGSALSVTLRSDSGLGTIGGEATSPAELRVRWTAKLPPGHTMVIEREGVPLGKGHEASLELRLTAPGSYRVVLQRSVPTWYFMRKTVTWIETHAFRLNPPLAQR